MPVPTFENLRLRGYCPRTLLDIGAHVGNFTRTFLESFPDTVPVLIEPNPHCQEALSRLPFEKHAVAASATTGTRELYLTREWLQSTGTSLYRENTPFFRDEVLVRHAVPAIKLDELFKGRRFDFVKIDVQGAELEVLQGGQQVLSQADYIILEVSMVEYNQGGAKPEAIFALMTQMGFHCADVLEFHRMKGVFDGNLLQMDFLFERNVHRPTQNHRYAALHDHAALLAFLKEEKRRCSNFTVIDVGAAAHPWSKEVIDATFDLNPCAVAPLKFTGNFNDARAWEPLLAHVAQHGRFSYCICSHTLEYLAYPAMALEMLPRIADAGYIAVPSRYLELLKPEGPYRGYIHHRWLIDAMEGQLMLVPKIPLCEYLPLEHEKDWAADPSRFEFQLIWRGGINFAVMNGDYLGPNRAHVIDLYKKFVERV